MFEGKMDYFLCYPDNVFPLVEGRGASVLMEFAEGNVRLLPSCKGGGADPPAGERKSPLAV